MVNAQVGAVSSAQEAIDEASVRHDSEAPAERIRSLLCEVRDNAGQCARRWFWELLQNAMDAKATIVALRISSERLCFEHNGDPFTAEDLVKLPRAGSSKTYETGPIGQFGTGFVLPFLRFSSRQAVSFGDS